MSDDGLQALRSRIAVKSLEILELLNERAEIALAIGRVKRQSGLPIHNPTRERELQEEIAKHNHGPLSCEAVARIFAVVFAETTALERDA